MNRPFRSTGTLFRALLSGAFALAGTIYAQEVVFAPGPPTGIAGVNVQPRSIINESGKGFSTQTYSSTLKRTLTWTQTTPSGVLLPTGSYTNTYANMISDTGAGVGYGQTGNIQTPLRWESDGSLTPLTPLGVKAGGPFEAASLSISPTGVAVGFSQNYNTSGFLVNTRALLWQPGSNSPTLLPFASSDGDYGIERARVISDSGLIAGDGEWLEDGLPLGTRGIRWINGNTTAQSLNPISTDTNGAGTVVVTGVNNSGMVIGNSTKYSGSTSLGLRAVRWPISSSTGQELGVVNASSTTGENKDTTAVGVDRYGNVAGLSQLYDGTVTKGTRPVVWRHNTTVPLPLQILGTDASGATRGNMSSMNNAGYIAGTMQSYLITPNARRAVVWGLDGTIYNLNDYLPLNSGWVLTIATDISDSGWVTGNGTYDADGAGPGAPIEHFFSMYCPQFKAHPPADSTNFAFSKIMYHPAAPTPAEITEGYTNADDFEYLEFINTGTTTIDLLALRVSGLVNFDFSAFLGSRHLPVGGRILLVANQAAFNFRYGTGKPVIGTFTGHLSDNGGEINVYGLDNALVTSVTYSSSPAWPTEPGAGAGHSLVRRQPNSSITDTNDPANWRSSVVADGSPGASDSDSLSAWKTRLGVSAQANTSDVDQDSLTTIEEYVHNGTPGLSDIHRQPTIGQALFTVEGIENTYTTFNFKRRINADDVSYLIQSNSSLNPTSWGPSNFIFVSATPLGDQMESVIYRSPIPLQSTEHQFLRLRLSVSP